MGNLCHKPILHSVFDNAADGSDPTRRWLLVTSMVRGWRARVVSR